MVELACRYSPVGINRREVGILQVGIRRVGIRRQVSL